MATLWMLTTDTPIQFKLSKEPTNIGRSPESTIRVDDPKVSKTHARLLSDSHGWSIEDLNSSNGTYVNGERVNSVRLAPGDRMRLGDVEFILDDSIVVEDVRADVPAGNQIIETMPVIPPDFFCGNCPKSPRLQRNNRRSRGRVKASAFPNRVRRTESSGSFN